MEMDAKTVTEGHSDDKSDEDNTDEIAAGRTQDYSWALHCPPTVKAAKMALADLRIVLRPQRADKTGYTDPKLGPVLEEHLRAMKDFLVTFTDLENKVNLVGGQWGKAALQVAQRLEKGEWFAHCLHQWTKQYIQDRTNLPICKQNSRPSHIENEELAVEIKLHLQSIGKYICAMDIIHYLEDPIVQKHHGLSQSVSFKTAQQ